MPFQKFFISKKASILLGVLLFSSSQVFSQSAIWDFNYSWFAAAKDQPTNIKTHYIRLGLDFNLFNDTQYGKTWIGDDLFIVGKENNHSNSCLGLVIYDYHDSFSGYFQKNIELDSNSIDTIKLSIRFDSKSKKSEYFIHLQFDSVTQYSYYVSPQKKDSDIQWRQVAMPIINNPKTDSVKITLAYKAGSKKGTSNWLYIDDVIFYEKKERTIK